MMQSLLRRAKAFFAAWFQILRSLSRHTWAAITATLLLLLFGFSFLGGTDAPAAKEAIAKSVEVRSVAALSSDTEGLSLSGIVTSKSEATVRAEKSGEVTVVRYELGDSVGAGSIVAEIENATERASVLQAQAGVEAARASGNVSGASLEAAQNTAVTALLGAYAAVENALEGTADDMFLSSSVIPKSYSFRVRTEANRARVRAEALRLELDAVLARQKTASASLTESSNVSAELERVERELRLVRELLDNAIIAMNEGLTDAGVSETELATYRTEATASRTAITAALSSIVGARQGLKTGEANAGSGASASAAAIKQAQATLAAARANLEHSYIRSPISGTINSLTLTRGDYAQQGTEVLTVANNSALEVVAYITDADARELEVGSDVQIGETARGKVTRIAPALDPITKKIEVRIGITSTIEKLLNGQSVTLSIARAARRVATTTSKRAIIPLSAIKIDRNEMVVFTLGEDMTLLPHAVVLGKLLGDKVEIVSGVSGDMEIVVDARGLRSGERVVVR